MNVGDRIYVNRAKEKTRSFWIGTIANVSKECPADIVLDDGKHMLCNLADLKPFLPKYDWQYGDNGFQEYYDVTIDDHYLLVFRNHPENHWLCSIDNQMIENKTRNNYYRNKTGISNPFGYHCMLSGGPAYLIKKTEGCYDHDQFEISA